MNILKIFRFSISGDNLDINELANKVKLPCKVFKQGEKIEKHYNKTYAIIQKTNRWLYQDVQSDSESASKFLTKNLRLLVKNRKDLGYFTENYKAKIELIIYADNKTDICLTATQIKLLNLLNVNFYISFC